MNLSIILEILRQQVSIDELLVIGGSAKRLMWRQIMSEIFDAIIIFPSILEEAGSMVATATGGVDEGLFKDLSVIDFYLFIDFIYTSKQEAVIEYKPCQKKPY